MIQGFFPLKYQILILFLTKKCNESDQEGLMYQIVDLFMPQN